MSLIGLELRADVQSLVKNRNESYPMAHSIKFVSIGIVTFHRDVYDIVYGRMCVDVERVQKKNTFQSNY